MCSTRHIKGHLIVALLLTVAPCLSQENLTGYWQPSIAVNYQIASGYSHNFSIQNRNYIYNDESSQLEIRQLDITHFSNYKLQDNQSIALGMLYRLRDTFDGGNNEVRLTQQYNIQSKPYVVRYGHRFRTEQRITSIKTTHRFRYRFSIDFPLQGEKLDVGEPYLVTNLESLLSLAKTQRPQYATRVTVNFGWKLSEKIKVQIGSEYRSEDLSQNLEHVVFLLSTLNISL